jgi:hypothetical protein
MQCLHSVHDRLVGKQCTSVRTALQLHRGAGYRWETSVPLQPKKSTHCTDCTQESATVADSEPAESVHTLIPYFLLVHFSIAPHL